MKQSWTQGLTPEKVKIVSSDYVGSAGMRIRLKELLDKKIKTSQAVARKKDGYEVANWAYLQADSIGYERALIEVISLISEINE